MKFSSNDEPESIFIYLLLKPSQLARNFAHGPEYAPIDTYRRRVKLPLAPYLLVTRVTHLKATRGVFQLLRDINAGGTCVVMATHDLDLVKSASYRSVELRGGEVVFDSAEGGEAGR